MICHKNAQTHRLPCFNVEQDPTTSGENPAIHMVFASLKLNHWLEYFGDFFSYISSLILQRNGGTQRISTRYPTAELAKWTGSNKTSWSTTTAPTQSGIPWACRSNAPSMVLSNDRSIGGLLKIQLSVLELTPLTTLWWSLRDSSCDSSCHSLSVDDDAAFSTFERSGNLKTMMSCCSN